MALHKMGSYNTIHEIAEIAEKPVVFVNMIVTDNIHCWSIIAWNNCDSLDRNIEEGFAS